MYHCFFVFLVSPAQKSQKNIMLWKKCHHSLQTHEHFVPTMALPETFWLNTNCTWFRVLSSTSLRHSNVTSGAQELSILSEFHQPKRSRHPVQKGSAWCSQMKYIGGLRKWIKDASHPHQAQPLRAHCHCRDGPDPVRRATIENKHIHRKCSSCFTAMMRMTPLQAKQIVRTIGRGIIINQNNQTGAVTQLLSTRHRRSEGVLRKDQSSYIPWNQAS